MTVSRRQALLAGAALPLIATLASSVSAYGHASAAPKPVHSDFNLLDFRVTTLLAGSRAVEEPQCIFGLNVDEDTFEAVSTENFIPTDATQFYFTSTVVNARSEVILFYTGLNSGGITSALVATS